MTTIEITQTYINGVMLIIASITLLYLRWKYIGKVTYAEHKWMIEMMIFSLVFLFIWAALTAFLNPIYYIKYL